MKSNPLLPFGAIAILGIGLMLIVSFYGASQLGASEETDTAKAEPQEIFVNNCASCHGENLEGTSGPALDTIGSSMSQDEILEQIKNGGPGMPPAIIQGEEAKSVAEWLSEQK